MHTLSNDCARQGMVIVYMVGMYVSSAPLVSQMHASTQRIDAAGRVKAAHKVPDLHLIRT